MYSYHDLKLYVCYILIQFRNHEFSVCYLNIACKLSRRFRSDVVDISVIVTEYILWNMLTVSDLPCFITKPISGLYFRVISPSLLGQSYDGKSCDCPKARGAMLNMMLCSRRVYTDYNLLFWFWLNCSVTFMSVPIILNKQHSGELHKMDLLGLDMMTTINSFTLGKK